MRHVDQLRRQALRQARRPRRLGLALVGGAGLALMTLTLALGEPLLAWLTAGVTGLSLLGVLEYWSAERCLQRALARRAGREPFLPCQGAPPAGEDTYPRLELVEVALEDRLLVGLVRWEVRGGRWSCLSPQGRPRWALPPRRLRPTARRARERQRASLERRLPDLQQGYREAWQADALRVGEAISSYSSQSPHGRR